ncbi:hypothetical protein AGLY_017919 [Aphis glycines]|uniref:Uncharacterized protein n=1 Tax=Aphis glycines TaxID=307491 RepID=A0A6G0STJ8_APHGL|nr:hypothetical protein AGLY_017919 [Aphis glycines]
MFTFNGYKHQGHSICSRKPPSKFVIGAFFRLVMLFAVFGPFFSCLCHFYEKLVEKCSLLTVSSIKDIRFAVENHPQNLPFSVLFFLVYVIYYENCGEMFTFNGYKHQGHSICSRKPPSKFVIRAFFRLVMLFSVFGHFFFVYLNYFENCWEMFTFNGYKHQGHSIFSRKPPSKFVIGVFFRLHQGHSICSRKPPSKFVIGAFFRLVMLFAVFGHFFFVYLNYFENCWEMFTFYGYKHQGHSICSRKPPSKFVIGAFFRLVMLYKETKKKSFRNL